MNTAVGHLLGVAGLQGQGRRCSASPARRSRWPSCARGTRTSTPRIPKLINQAVADLQQLYDICNIKVGDLQYQTIPEGSSWLNQAWSGDMMAGYFYYLPKGTPATLLRLLEAAQGQGADPERLLVDLLDHQEAGARAPLPQLHARQRRRLLTNFVNFNGYQPPLNEIDPSTLVAEGRRAPRTSRTAILTNDDFGPDSLQEMTLTTRASSSGRTATRIPRRGQ